MLAIFLSLLSNLSSAANEIWYFEDEDEGGIVTVTFGKTGICYAARTRHSHLYKIEPDNDMYKYCVYAQKQREREEQEEQEEKKQQCKKEEGKVWIPAEKQCVTQEVADEYYRVEQQDCEKEGKYWDVATNQCLNEQPTKEEQEENNKNECEARGD